MQLMGGLLGVPLGLESCLKGPRTCSKQVSWGTQTQESCSEDTDVLSHRPLKTRGRAYMQDHSGKCQPWSGGRVGQGKWWQGLLLSLWRRRGSEEAGSGSSDLNSCSEQLWADQGRAQWPRV